MTNFESMREKTPEELASFIYDFIYSGNFPWDEWWDDNFCRKCETIVTDYGEVSWCEVNDEKCKFFLDLEEIPSAKEVIELWLQQEI